MGKIFAIGDIHGNYKALMQCFERSKFDYQKDRLICLGDVVDGHVEVKRCIDELMKIKDLILILGNHDKWFMDWLQTGNKPKIWLKQGGQETIDSFNVKWTGYGVKPDIDNKYLDFFKNAILYYKHQNRLFVHGGIDPRLPLSKQKNMVLLWDRNLIQVAKSLYEFQNKYLSNEFNDYGEKLTTFKEIYIGHSSTQGLAKTTFPIKYCEIRNLDTGAGWSGKLTIMNVKTNEFFQSDLSDTLYPKKIEKMQRKAEIDEYKRIEKMIQAQWALKDKRSQ